MKEEKMSISFYVAPFTGRQWRKLGHSPTEQIGDLVINPDEYKNEMTKRWPTVEFQAPAEVTVPHFALQWKLPTSNPEYSGLKGYLYPNLQVVSFGFGPKGSFLEFILWHRSFIPPKYKLYLFNSSSTNSLPIKQTTTGQDIIDFTGIED